MVPSALERCKIGNGRLLARVCPDPASIDLVLRDPMMDVLEFPVIPASALGNEIERSSVNTYALARRHLRHAFRHRLLSHRHTEYHSVCVTEEMPRPSSSPGMRVALQPPKPFLVFGITADKTPPREATFPASQMLGRLRQLAL